MGRRSSSFLPWREVDAGWPGDVFQLVSRRRRISVSKNATAAVVREPEGPFTLEEVELGDLRPARST